MRLFPNHRPFGDDPYSKEDIDVGTPKKDYDSEQQPPKYFQLQPKELESDDS